jgi:hypothetical protein
LVRAGCSKPRSSFDTPPFPTWHDGGRKRKRTGLWSFFWVGGSSKGLANSNDESSKKLADSSGESSKKLADAQTALSLIKSEDRAFEKAQRTGTRKVKGCATLLLSVVDM